MESFTFSFNDGRNSQKRHLRKSKLKEIQYVFKVHNTNGIHYRMTKIYFHTVLETVAIVIIISNSPILKITIIFKYIKNALNF